MGRDNKLLLLFREKPMVRGIAETLLASEADEVLVVTGYQHQQIEEALTGLPVRLVYNPDYYSGMASGIRAGLEAAGDDTEAILVLPADMPLLQPMHINALIRKFKAELEKGRTPIIRPVYHDKPGFPVIFHRSFWQAIKECRDQDGCQPVIQENAAHFIPYALANQAYYLDIDTPKDYYKLRE